MLYKTDYIRCTFSTGARFNEQLQRMLDDYTDRGCLLHSWHMMGSDSVCQLVFYREDDEEMEQ